MFISKSKTAGALVLASVLLFAGCEGVTHEPKVDVASLKDISTEDFYSALSTVGVDESDTQLLENTTFTFSEDDTEYDVIYGIDASSDTDNFYSYTKCADEATAKALFEYYYSGYTFLFDSKDFSGIQSHEVGGNTAYLLIDGRYDDKNSGTYTPYHDALFLKGDMVIVAMASDYDLSIEKEVNNFLDALGYPHP